MDSIKTENPWDVTSLEDFLYYCCPECDIKTKDSQDFLNHAVTKHELAKVSLMIFTQDCDPDSYLNEEETEVTPDLPMDIEGWDNHDEEDIKPDLKLLEQQVTEGEPAPDSIPMFRPDFGESSEEENPKRNRKNEKKIRCDLCKEKFVTHAQLAKHEQAKHLNEAKCDKCDFQCNSKRQLKKHERTNHIYILGEDGRYHCELCEFHCSTPSGIRKHRNYKHLNVDKYKCDICQKTFNMRHTFEKHKKAEHLGELPYHCNKCDFKAKTAWNLNLHKKKVHIGTTTEVCHICGKDFANVYNLKAHIESMHGGDQDKDVICDICGKTYKASGLKKHIYYYHELYKVCTLCEMIVPGKRKLIDHLSSQHAIHCHKNDIFICEICHTRFQSSKELSNHLNSEHQLKNEFHCTKCDHSSPSKITLTVHMVECHEYNPSKDLDTLGTTKKVIHEVNTNAFPCDLCDKRYSSQRTLDGHKRQVHDKSNHFKCDQCEYSSFERYKLRKHIEAKHMKQTKYPCDKCSFVTNILCRLTHHIKIVHDDIRDFKCTECPEAYKNKTRLAQHLLREHNIVYKYQ